MIESAEEFRRLRLSEDLAEYERAAREPASEAVWNDVLDRFPELAEWVAHNKTIPEAIVRRLAAAGDRTTRCTLAARRSTPPDVLVVLCRDPEDSVRLAVARNPKAPADALALLCADAWDEVRRVALARRSS